MVCLRLLNGKITHNVREICSHAVDFYSKLFSTITSRSTPNRPKVLNVFGFGKGFSKWVRLLYSGATGIVKVGGGFSFPISVKRGLRQGCPLSGQLYSKAIGPLVCKLHEKISVLSPGISDNLRSAYAHDVTVLVNNIQDVKNLSVTLNVY